jgi:hypothetical protein
MGKLTIEQWISNTIEKSKSDWMIAVFKLEGSFTDANGIKRQVLSQQRQFYRALDWTIQSSRRKLKCEISFIPFIGGDPSLGIATHIHAFVEIPPKVEFLAARSVLNDYWQDMPERTFKTAVVPFMWSEMLDKSQALNHIYYCSRYEGFIKGADKVLFELKSCLL